MNDLVVKRQWLIENPTPRVPICLCLDCSPSMSGKPELGAPPDTIGVPIDELNDGVRLFFNTIKNDEIAKYSAEIAIVAFSGVAELVLDFNYIENVEVPTLELDLKRGGTSIGEAVRLAIDALERRKQEYKHAGVDYYQPWLILMTDGYPTDDSHIPISQKIKSLVLDKKLVVFPIGIGSGSDMDVLKMFSPTRPPLRLKGLNFREFFEWLSQSVSRVSQSTPSEKVKLDIEGIKRWGAL